MFLLKINTKIEPVTEQINGQSDNLIRFSLILTNLYKKWTIVFKYSGGYTLKNDRSKWIEFKIIIQMDIQTLGYTPVGNVSGKSLSSEDVI